MIVNFEFLDNEPLENVITSMNYGIDKTVFFGYADTIEKHKGLTSDFLHKYCGVKKVSFVTVPSDDLHAVLGAMHRRVAREKASGNRVFFDVTGGEDMILVAFGMIAREFSSPIHMFDVESGALTEYAPDGVAPLSAEAPVRRIPLTVDMYVRLHGGIINTKMHKEAKNALDLDFVIDVNEIYRISLRYRTVWNSFSEFLRSKLTPVSADLKVSKKFGTLNKSFPDDAGKKKLAKYEEILKALEKYGIVTDFSDGNGRLSFTYKNQRIKECLWDGGSVLELHTCLQEARQSSEAMVSVHLDWDGVVKGQGSDVLNEIDVLSVKGNVISFISCKSGKMKREQILHALYELDTVARRFGGKYAKKVFVTSYAIPEVHLRRAAEMGIEVRMT